MDLTKQLALITEDIVSKYASEEEAFTLFVTKEFIVKGKLDVAAKQIESGLGVNEYAYLSYLYLIIIYHSIGNVKRAEESVKRLKDLNPDEEIITIMDKILSIKAGYKNVFGYDLLDGSLKDIQKRDGYVNGWVFVDENDRLVSRYMVSDGEMKYIIQLHKFVKIKNMQCDKMIEKIGKISSLYIEYASRRVMFLKDSQLMNLYIFGSGDEFTYEYLKLHLGNKIG